MALAGGRGTPLSGSCMMLTRMSMVVSLSVRDDTLALSRPSPPSRTALRGSTGALFCFFLSLSFETLLSSTPLSFSLASLLSIKSSAKK